MADKKIHDKCTIEEFAIYFLNFIRNQTEEIFRISTLQAKDTQIENFNEDNDENKNSNNSNSIIVSPPTTNTTLHYENSNKFTDLNDSLQILNNSDIKKNHNTASKFLYLSPANKLEKKFDNHSIVGNIDLLSKTSTPIKHKHNNTFPLLNTNEGKSTDRLNNNSQNKGNHNTSLCLGDFIIIPPSSSASYQSKQKHPRKNVGNSHKNLCSKISPINKPKRRIIPTLASKFTRPNIQNENNILEISKEEVVDRNSCVIQKERAILKHQVDTIAKEFQAETLSSPRRSVQLSQMTSKSKNSLELLVDNIEHNIDLTKVTNKTILQRLIDIHSALIELNFITNILSEISFLLNFFSCDAVDIANEPFDIMSTNGLLEKSNSLEDNILLDSQPISHLEKIEQLNFILKNKYNCFFYAVGVLEKQKFNLALLDVPTLKVILDNQRIGSLSQDLKEFLLDVLQHKVKLENVRSLHEKSYKIGNNFQNVFYQQENDTKNNFPSDKEFGAFKKQRDLFYFILKSWETKHLNRAWDFEQELGPKIQNLFSVMENPITMAHLAKLFTSQLIISSNFSCSLPDELDIGLANVDANKLLKLRQRLVAPSHFSTDYQFPGNELFFKEFLLFTKSIMFMEQLKIALISELIEINDSSYEIINLSNRIKMSSTEKIDQNGTNEPINVLEFMDRPQNFNEYVVSPDIIYTMRVLAKFLGLLMAQPFQYSGNRNHVVESRQIELRNKVQPQFNVLQILQKSIIERKLLITIPWLVQYLSMLDSITLKLNYYRQLFQILFEISINLTNPSLNIDFRRTNEKLQMYLNEMRPTSLFIIKSCLGWLFDYSNLTEEYAQFRKNRSIYKVIQFNRNKKNEMISLKEVRNDLHKSFSSQLLINSNHKTRDEIHFNINISELNKTNGAPLKISNGVIKVRETASLPLLHLDQELPLKSKSTMSLNLVKTFDPLLESILHVACPFLADFRVSIMPTKMSKCVSRTGRLRHITTNISIDSKRSNPNVQLIDSPVTIENYSMNSSEKLVEAFLHSQSLSVRRIVEFVIERTTSAVIKDFQVEILLPSKSNAFQDLEKIISLDMNIVFNKIRDIFSDAHKLVLEKWEIEVPKMIQNRVNKAMESLLPNETSKVVKNACISIVIKKSKLKTQDWCSANLNSLDFYSKDIAGEADKLIKNTKILPIRDNQHIITTALEIDMKQQSLSDIFTKLQFWLHFILRRSEYVNESDLCNFCDEFLIGLSSHKLPTSYYRISGQTTVAMMQTLLLKHTQILSDKLLNKFIDIWRLDGLQFFINQTCENSDELIFENNDTDEENKNDYNQEINIKKSDLNSILDIFISDFFIRQLLYHQEAQIAKYSEFLIKLIENNLMNLDYLNSKFIKLLKLEWNPNECQIISNILNNITRNSNVQSSLNCTDEKSHLFMEMLSDLLRDSDDF